VNWRSKCSPIEDQGNLGSCVAQAIVGALEFLERKAGDDPFNDLSRLFVYYQARAIENSILDDAGCEIRDGVKGCAKIGVPREEIWPYRISDFAKAPSTQAYADATAHKIASYWKIASDLASRQSLADGYPVVFGCWVYESFESNAVDASGTVPMPQSGEAMLGGHAMLRVGYNDVSQRWIVRNSWGKWGRRGYCTMPYAYPCSDLWTIRR
jgi:C1A family cysteine protease